MSEKEYKYIELKKKGKICILRLNRPVYYARRGSYHSFGKI